MTTECKHRIYIFRYINIDYDDNDELLSWNTEKVCWDCTELLEDMYGNKVC